MVVSPKTDAILWCRRWFCWQLDVPPLVNWKTRPVYTRYVCVAVQRQLLLISCKFYVFFCFFGTPPEFTLRRTATFGFTFGCRSFESASVDWENLSLTAQNISLGKPPVLTLQEGRSTSLEWWTVWSERILKVLYDIPVPFRLREIYSHSYEKGYFTWSGLCEWFSVKDLRPSGLCYCGFSLASSSVSSTRQVRERRNRPRNRTWASTKEQNTVTGGIYEGNRSETRRNAIPPAWVR